jgi:predicted DsbA family dithiol-disulfide isomerase
MKTFMSEVQETKNDNKDQSVVELTIDQINNLSIDDLLDYKVNNKKVVVNANNPFTVRWNDNGLDVSKDREELILNGIQALQLKVQLENEGNKFCNKSMSNILKLGEKINDSDIINNILDIKSLDFKANNKSIINSENAGFNELFNLVVKINNTSNKLMTLGGKVDYIVDKLKITDITEYIFIILAIDAMESMDED